MIGKIQITSTGYNPDEPHHPDNFDGTLGDGKVTLTRERIEAARKAGGGNMSYLPGVKLTVDEYRAFWNAKPVDISLTPVGRRLLIAEEDGTLHGAVNVPPDMLPKELRLFVILGVGGRVHLTHKQLRPGRLVWLRPYNMGVEIIVNGAPVRLVLPESIVGLAQISEPPVPTDGGKDADSFKLNPSTPRA